MLPNCPQGVIAYYGTLLVGGIAVMTNPLYVPREIEHQLTDSGANIIVTMDALVERVHKAMERKPLQYTIVTSMKDYLPFPKNVLYPIKAKKDGMAANVEYNEHILSFVSLLKNSVETPVEVPVDPEHDLALIQYTGGTTGFAKGVMLTHMNLVSNTIQAQLWSYRTQMAQEKYLAALPFFHVFGLTVLLNQAMYIVGTLILIPRFQVDDVLKTIHKKKPTIFPGAPTMYIAVIHHPEVGLGSISLRSKFASAEPRRCRLKCRSGSSGLPAAN